MLEKSYTLFCLDDGQRTLQIVEQVAHSACPVLIVGEAGTGKRNIAEKIHAAGAAEGAPFQAIDCAEATQESLDSAARRGGSLYLRGVSQLKPALQQSILRLSGSSPIRSLAFSRNTLVDAARVGGMR